MTKVLDFNELKKHYLTIKLADEKGTVLMIGTPTKAILDEFMSIQGSISAEAMGEESIGNLYSLVAKIMSRNKAGIKITKDKVSSVFDFEDIIVFLHTYSEFIRGVVTTKN